MRNDWFFQRLIWLYRLKKGGSGGQLVTVSGTTPLSLPGALAKPIKSLTQYGKMVQDGTPTPPAPVWPVINNGTVGMQHRSGLPVRYQLLTWLRSTAVVDVGIKTTNDTELEAAWTRIIAASQYVYQSDSNSSGSSYTTAYISSSGNWRFGNRVVSVAPSLNTRYVSVQNSDGVSLNGERVASYGTVESFTSDNNLKMFGSGASLQVEYLKVRKSGVLVRDLVPVHDTVDDVYGLYDFVSGAFYTNADATFTPGGEVDDPIEVVAVGTPEVLTVGEQTATVPDLYAVGDYKDEVDLVSGTVTRKVGVKVLDGTESWIYQSNRFRLSVADRVIAKTGLFCTQFVYSDAVSTTMPDGSVVMASASDLLCFRKDDISTLADWKSYLAAQYAAGTPVIVLYPLATETTEQVAGQALSTVQGDNVVSVTAEVSDIELTATYKAGG